MRRASGHAFLPDDSTLADPAIDVAPLAGTKQVTDAHLLNLAARHAMQFATFDGSLVRALAVASRNLFVVHD